MQSKLLKTMTQNEVLTENSAKTNSTTLNSVLDLFFLAGATRQLSEQEIISKLSLAYNTNPELTLKLVFWAGDIRKGLGERRFFQTCLKWLNDNHGQVVNKNLNHIPFYNRCDSLFEIAHDNNLILDYIHNKLKEGDALLSKWMPRRKQYNNLQHLFCKTFSLTYKQYRKLITKNNTVVEQKMCKKQWGDIKYESVPSVASKKYRKAFAKNDSERYGKYIDSVLNGDAKMNAGAIFPHDVIYEYIKESGLHLWERKIVDSVLKNSIIAQWDSLPNLLKDNKCNILPVCDVSGSMYGEGKNSPINICLALGIYLSERNEGIFKDSFITFSENPKLQYLKGNVCDRVGQLHSSNWGYNTNLQSVFDLILKTCIDNNLSQQDIPEKVIIFSDMEFDEATRGTSNFELINKKFRDAGYERPDLIFWNLESRSTTNYPVQQGEDGTALVSGFSPNILINLFNGKLTPEDVMLDTLNSERYEKIKI